MGMLIPQSEQGSFREELKLEQKRESRALLGVASRAARSLGQGTQG